MEIKKLPLWSGDFHPLLKTVYRKNPGKPFLPAILAPRIPGDPRQSSSGHPRAPNAPSSPTGNVGTCSSLRFN